MKQQNWTIALVLATVASVANAEIVNDSYWEAEHDFTNSSIKVDVIDGIVFGTSDFITHRIHSSWTSVGHPDMSSYMSLPNVMRVSSNFPEAKFNAWSPSKNSIYSYGSFLKAVAKFPAFCNET